MPTPWKALCTTLAASTLLAGPPAEARFGKHSSRGANGPSRPAGTSGIRSRPSNTGGTHGASSPGGSQRVHRATPIGQDDQDGRPDDAPVRPPPRPRVTRARGALIDFAATVYVSRRTRSRAAPVARVATEEAPAPLMLRLGVQGDRLGGGGAVNFFMAMEGRQLGLDTRVTGLALPADDGSDEVDRLTLLSAHATASLWSSDRGRFRVEAGISTAHAPDVVFVGPSFAASTEACIGRSPLDFEARVQATPFPYRQVDTQIGAALHMGALLLRAGWRGLYLDDAGLVDGINHREALAGPYLGLGLAF